jgi:hypothetical protein
MLRLIKVSLLAFGLFAYMPLATASADRSDGVRRAHHGGKRHGGKFHGGHFGRRHAGHGSSRDVPELDPTAAAGALTLLAGGALALGGRRRRNAA